MEEHEAEDDAADAEGIAGEVLSDACAVLEQASVHEPMGSEEHLAEGAMPEEQSGLAAEPSVSAEEARGDIPESSVASEAAQSTAEEARAACGADAQQAESSQQGVRCRGDIGSDDHAAVTAEAVAPQGVAVVSGGACEAGVEVGTSAPSDLAADEELAEVPGGAYQETPVGGEEADSEGDSASSAATMPSVDEACGERSASPEASTTSCTGTDREDACEGAAGEIASAGSECDGGSPRPEGAAASAVAAPPRAAGIADYGPAAGAPGAAPAAQQRVAREADEADAPAEAAVGAPAGAGPGPHAPRGAPPVVPRAEAPRAATAGPGEELAEETSSEAAAGAAPPEGGAEAERRRKRDAVKRAASRFMSKFSRNFGNAWEEAAEQAEPALVRKAKCSASFDAPGPSLQEDSRQSSLSQSFHPCGATFAEGDAKKRASEASAVEGGAFHKLLHAQTMGRMVVHGKRRRKRAPSAS